MVYLKGGILTQHSNVISTQKTGAAIQRYFEKQLLWEISRIRELSFAKAILNIKLELY